MQSGITAYKYILLLGFIVWAYDSRSQDKNPDSLPQGCVQLTADEMKWIDTLSTLPKGTQFCQLYGDIKKEGPFAVRLKLPPNLVLKTHYHPNDEVVTVLEGSIFIGLEGAPISRTSKEFKPGSFYVNAKHIRHQVNVGPNGATIQINSMGPWKVIFE